MPEEIVDVLIIGSGHSGGMAAKILTEKGISCLMLNAGPVADVHKDTEVKPAYAFPFADSNSPASSPTSFSPTNSTPTPGSTKKKSPTPTIRRNHTTGCACASSAAARSSGRAQSFRLSDYEFKAKSHDGYGDDWPISLADLAPYYSRVEEIFRVQGHPNGLPQFPDGNFVPDTRPWSGKACCASIAVAKERNIPRLPASALRSASTASPAPSICCCPTPSPPASSHAIPNVVVREITRRQKHRPGQRSPLRRSPSPAAKCR